MFGPTLVEAAGGVSRAGRPRLPIRVMVSLLYLKHAFNERDESVVERWSENVVWQLFSGMEYYQSKLPVGVRQIHLDELAWNNRDGTYRRSYSPDPIACHGCCRRLPRRTRHR
ncbi:transposase [Roseateles sp. DC23W]|uniref:Transposase n=1 Tax=Pelomonas dachongensis TaxID=3299029 RepID=A0ABW7EVA9_9BURK